LQGATLVVIVRASASASASASAIIMTHACVVQRAVVVHQSYPHPVCGYQSLLHPPSTANHCAEPKRCGTEEGRADNIPTRSETLFGGTTRVSQSTYMGHIMITMISQMLGVQMYLASIYCHIGRRHHPLVPPPPPPSDVTNRSTTDLKP